MTEHKIAGRVRASLTHVKKESDSHSKWVFWLTWVYYGLGLAAGVTAIVMGAGGKPVADLAGALLTDSPDATTAAGWRSVCATIAVLIVGAHFVGKQLANRQTKLDRAHTLHASLKNLQVDIDDMGREPKEVSRDYQRLNDAFPELAD